jgi:lipopolysaccharide transport system permease protein
MSVLAPIARLYKYRELIALLVGRDLKVRYKRSILGMLWTLINPLLQMVVYTLVFSKIMKIATPAYPVFLLSGLLPWTLISVATTSSSYALLGNQGLIRKVAVPQAVYPLTIVGSKLVDLVLSLVPLAILASFLSRPPGLPWLILVPAIVLVTAFTAGLSLLVSSLTVFFRDVRHLIDILFQVWFYLTPVFYPYEYLEKLSSVWVRRLFSLNPATPIVRCFQMALYEGRFPDLRTGAIAAAIATVSLTFGFVVFLKFEHRHIQYF